MDLRGPGAPRPPLVTIVRCICINKLISCIILLLKRYTHLSFLLNNCLKAYKTMIVTYAYVTLFFFFLSSQVELKEMSFQLLLEI